MSVEKTTLKNITSLFGAQLITSLLTPLLLIYIARTLGDEIFGKYSFIMSLTAIFLIVSEFGIKSVAVRDVARDTAKAGQYLRNLVSLKLVFSFLIMLLLILFVHALDVPPDTTRASYIFAVGLFFQSLSYAFRWVFHALQIMEYEALQRVAERFLLLVLSVWVLWHGFGLIALSLVFLATQIIICLLSLIFAVRKTRIPSLTINLSFWKYLVKTAVFFALCEVLWMIYFRVDMVMLAKIRGEEEVGWYNAAYAVVNFVTLISMLTMQALFPVLSSLYEKKKGKLKQTAERLFRYLILLALGIVPVVWVLSPRIINLLFGSEYSHSVTALQILIFVIIFLFPGNLFAHVLASSNRHKSLALVNFIGVLMNIGLNLILIPKYGYRGAGIATIITEVMLCFLLYAVMSKFIKIQWLKIVLSLLPGLTAMVLIIYAAGSLWFIPVIVFALLVYFFFAFLTGSINKEDVAFFIDILRKKSSD
ncbi:MAG: flippase [Candidatus Aminicenantes bacterium]